MQKKKLQTPSCVNTVKLCAITRGKTKKNEKSFLGVGMTAPPPLEALQHLRGSALSSILDSVVGNMEYFMKYTRCINSFIEFCSHATDNNIQIIVRL